MTLTSDRTATFMTVGDLRDTINQLISGGQVDLPLESGVFKTNGMKGWIPISFRRRFATMPAITVQGTSKKASLTTYKVDLPSISVPSITLPSVTIPSFTVPDVTIPSIPYTIPRLNIVEMLSGYSTIAKYLGAQNKNKYLADTTNFDWWPATIAREVGAVGAYSLGYFIGTFFDWFVKDYIQPHFDNVEATLKKIKSKIDVDIIGTKDSPKVGSINKALDDLEEAIQGAIDGIVNGTNTAIETIRDGAQSGFDAIRDGINDGLEQSEKAIEDSINMSIKRLYDYIGVLDSAPFVPTKIKDVTTDGFKLYSTGVLEYHWIAVGV